MKTSNAAKSFGFIYLFIIQTDLFRVQRLTPLISFYLFSELGLPKLLDPWWSGIIKRRLSTASSRQEV